MNYTLPINYGYKGATASTSDGELYVYYGESEYLDLLLPLSSGDGLSSDLLLFLLPLGATPAEMTAASFAVKLMNEQKG